MIVFAENKKLLQEHRQLAKGILEENPDMAEYIRIPETLDDVFCPYNKWLNSITAEERAKYHIVADENLSFDGVYVVGDCNDHYRIKSLTDYDEVDSLYDYGVVDNATQVLQNAKIPENSVILMSPIFKEDQGDYGWRWHKWGPYYGIQNHRCEYLADEEGTEMIYVFSVVTLKPKENIE